MELNNTMKLNLEKEEVPQILDFDELRNEIDKFVIDYDRKHKNAISSLEAILGTAQEILDTDEVVISRVDTTVQPPNGKIKLYKNGKILKNYSNGRLIFMPTVVFKDDGSIGFDIRLDHSKKISAKTNQKQVKNRLSDFERGQSSYKKERYSYKDDVYEDDVYEDDVYEDDVYEDDVYEDDVYEDDVYEDTQKDRHNVHPRANVKKTSQNRRPTTDGDRNNARTRVKVHHNESNIHKEHSSSESDEQYSTIDMALSALIGKKTLQKGIVFGLVAILGVGSFVFSCTYKTSEKETLKNHSTTTILEKYKIKVDLDNEQIFFNGKPVVLKEASK